MIRMAAEDGVITEKEKALIIKKAKDLGEDVDMVELAIEGELGQLKKESIRATSRGKKCPNCGAIIPAGSAVCPQCGFALTKAAANSVAVELQRDLDKIDKELNEKVASLKKDVLWGKSTTLRQQAYDRKVARIVNTVIPNSRADLIELTAFSAAKANKKDADEFSFGKAYWSLFSNCVLMAKSSFADDPAFQTYFRKYDSENVKVMTKNKEMALWMTGFGIFFILIMLFVSISSSNEDKRKSEIMVKIEQNIKEKDFDAAKAAAQGLDQNDRTKVLDDILVQQIQYYVTEGKISAAKFLIGTMTDEGKRAQLSSSLESLSDTQTE